jgi:hypothetical protein
MYGEHKPLSRNNVDTGKETCWLDTHFYNNAMNVYAGKFDTGNVYSGKDPARLHQERE